ncbi:hypothetical protein DFP97_107281 [Paenibacillus prosopidis]|uniref:MerR family transcriptional regulator n=1 Tax=Paenibacillus prosopidis TaxID=630520 RepID=A0A368W082_9BACL|nr:hypothetical protein DFP97_107281 [Paenibacillus prosopidis]
MGITNCTKCGQVMFNRQSFFCMICTDELKDDIEKVKTYLRNHSKPTLLEVHKMTGIPIKTIQEFIKEGIISRY